MLTKQNETILDVLKAVMCHVPAGPTAVLSVISGYVRVPDQEFPTPVTKFVSRIKLRNVSLEFFLTV